MNKYKNQNNKMRGNAMLYVLIAIVLFAALSMTLGRQTDTDEAGDLSDARARAHATQIIAYSAAAKSAADQMLFSNTRLANIDFTLPGQAGFNTAPTITKIYHPDGGGLNPGRLASDAVKQGVSDPVAGWYIGRFNNVEWTATTGTDIILTAFQINRKICEIINETLTGSTAIPTLTVAARAVLIDDAIYTGVTNTDLTTDPAGSPVCADCHRKASLCVKDNALDVYAFYTIVADR